MNNFIKNTLVVVLSALFLSSSCWFVGYLVTSFADWSFVIHDWVAARAAFGILYLLFLALFTGFMIEEPLYKN